MIPDPERRAAAYTLIEYGRRLNPDGLAVGPAGNLSVRLGDVVAITPSQIRYEDIVPESICFVTVDGRHVGGEGKLSAETPMHLSVYRETDAAAIVHTHSPRAVAVSTVVDELPAVHYCVLRAGGGPTIRVAPYERFGSDALARVALEGLAERTAVLLQNHGAITYGADLAEAYERAQLVEWLADVYLAARGLGAPRILTPDELGEVASESARRRYGGAKAASR
ncbi:class II aldolase/adducin family protein [Blastococcus sp. VKM Ac-2987]|uniref:class II aldolase/adducin family protein n=1 Tax=Blastococcus sp. VKM Ac-2987 TaxID=3004141 RepID=UPI0022AB9614|nr:class II aldolase/adducin family protein [Blastococcus sp. VKM Ac-2987]MCZ2859291.1 class II aldolase/adducin family protein [Blastococcus sp. VKM Ac-2987]